MWDWEQEFWRENKQMNEVAFGDRWVLTWTLAVILLIFICTLLRSGFRGFFFRGGGGPMKSQPCHPLAPLRNVAIISDLDLKNLIDNLDDNSHSRDNVKWENVCDKRNNDLSYKAKFYKPKDGPLKYLSITTFENCSVELLVNFYMDNCYRMLWDKTVVRHESLLVDKGSGTEIGRTIKKFPFLTPREYVLAWKLWQGKDGSFYCFCKECEHPSAPRQRRGYVRVSVFRSGWRIRKVPGRNACEIRMVHQEDAGLNVEMAKLAFSKGIWSYVCKMDDALRKYSSGKQLQLNSTASATMFVEKVPPEFEVTNNTTSSINSENSMANVMQRVGTRKSNRMELTKRPSNKLISNGLILIGGAIYLSRGHSSLGAKVAVAYLLSKLTRRDVSSNQATKIQCNKGQPYIHTHR